MAAISLHKHVNFGEVILIVGDCVQWQVHNGIQMQWNHGDIWTATIEYSLPMQYRYVVVQQATRQIVQWEDGNNRILNDSQPVHDIWGQTKVMLKLLTYSDVTIQLNLYSSAGRTKLSMTKIESELFEHTIEFHIPRNQVTHYAYKYQSNGFWERGPARHLNKPMINNVLSITDVDADFNVNYNEITDNIIVGSYFYKEYEMLIYRELHILSKQGITAILNLQTKEDLLNKDLPEDYFNQIKELCEFQGVQYSQCPIRDCNRKSFLQKGMEAYTLLKNLIRDGKKIYVHCTDGIQRSVQTIIMYLVLDMNYTLEGAIKYMQSIRLRSKPIREVLQQLV